MKKKNKGNRIILFFITIIAIVWVSSGVLIAKPFILANTSSYSQASEYSLNNIEISNNIEDVTNSLIITNNETNHLEEIVPTLPTYKINEKDINIPILIYHEVTTNLPKKDIYDLYILASRFEENIITLLDAGYTFITFDDVYNYYNGKIGLPEKVVLITADDGWKRKLY